MLKGLEDIIVVRVLGTVPSTLLWGVSVRWALFHLGSQQGWVGWAEGKIHRRKDRCTTEDREEYGCFLGPPGSELRSPL